MVVRADGHYGSLHPSDAPLGLMDGARELLRRGDSGVLVYDAEDVRVFVRPLVPPPRMLLFGAGDFAGALAAIGRTMDYRVTVCDARPLFTTADRFPDADEVVVARPDQYLAREAAAGRGETRTVIVSFSHDPKFDVPLLETALGLDVAYVGAMGSRRTHVHRAQALREPGVRAHPDPAVLPRRPTPGRPLPRGDGRLDRRRDHRDPLRRPRGTTVPPRQPRPHCPRGGVTTLVDSRGRTATDLLVLVPLQALRGCPE